ncbi:MAG: hypothetical protein ACQETO_07850 [Pseudomonadota bacterium]
MSRGNALTTLLPSFLLGLMTTAACAADDDALPRTAWGHPDLQGIWSNATQTPLERPASYGEQRAMSEAEAMDREAVASRRQEQSNQPSDPDRPPPQDGNTAAAYNSFWLDRGVNVAHIDGEYRTSMIIEPEDGQIPYRDDRPLPLLHQWRGDNPDEFAGPEQATIGERCLLFYDFRTSNSSVGPPMMPMIYNNLYQIVQTPDYVVIMAEMMHDARIIRLDDEHQPDAIHQWMGDSVGHWEGDTLVIETRNLHPQQSHFGSSSDLVVTEELTRVSEEQINYRFTMRDPDVYTQPWTAEMPFRTRPDERIYEYACHEGNYALPGILAGARREQQDTAAAEQGE